MKRFLIGSIVGFVLGGVLAGGLVWRSRSPVIKLRTVQGTVSSLSSTGAAPEPRTIAWCPHLR